MSLRRNVIPAPSGQREDALKRMFHEKAAFAGPVGTLQDIGVVETDGTLHYSVKGGGDARTGCMVVAAQWG